MVGNGGLSELSHPQNRLGQGCRCGLFLKRAGGPGGRLGMRKCFDHKRLLVNNIVVTIYGVRGALD